MKTMLCLILSFAWTVPSFAQDALQVRQGDRIVFYGDSITEQELYTKNVEAYLSQRYPDHHLTFFNAGWSGDNANGGKTRLDRDVLGLKPTLVTICFGMNDATYSKPWEGMAKYFIGDMADMLKRLRAAKVRVVFLTPGTIDQTDPEMKWLTGTDYNAEGLQLLTDAVLALGKEQNVPVYDLHSLMLEAMKKGRHDDKAFKMHKDGIHPNAAGHVVMTYALLKALGVPEWHRGLTVDLGQPASKGEGISVSGVHQTPKGYAMKVQFDRLPFFVEKDARKMLPYVPFQEDFNLMKVSFTGLKGGPYVLQMGEGETAELTASELAAGVNLASLWRSPASRRSEALENFVQAKFDIYYRYWRQLAMPGDYIISSPYDPSLHKVGILASEKLEPLGWKMALPEPQGYDLVLKPAEKKKTENKWGKKR